MSTIDYSNQEALNRALNIYRTYMRSFIIFHLKKIRGQNVKDIVIDSLNKARQFDRANAIENMLRGSDRDIKSIIDINDFPHLISKNWKGTFERPLNDDKTFCNQLWLIVECRNEDWAHPPEGDAESEGTRAYLFLIADVLGKIKRPNEKHEIEVIRDKLFSDDSAERLREAEKRLKDVEAENAEYKKSLEEVETNLKTAESEKTKYEKNNTTLSKQIDEKEKRLKKLSRQVKNAKTQNDKYKKNLAGTKQRLEKSEAAQVSYKERLETTSKELKDKKNELAAAEIEKTAHQERLETTAKELEEAKSEWSTCEENLKSASDRLEDAIGEWMVCMERLAAMRNLFTIAAIGNQAIQEIFPPFETNAAVRILDRRETNKQHYLLNLLEQEESTIIYVQSEEKIDQLLTLVGPEKAAAIGKHNERTSEAEETEILEKLENKELIAVVSNAAFSTLTPSHSVEHVVFCHLVPGLDTFFEQCQPAFTSEKNTYLHLIYDSEQDIEGLVQKYPDREVLEKLYPELRNLAETNGNFIQTENLYNKLDIAKLWIETGLAIFEELQLLEQNGEGIKLLPPAGKKLDESEIYRRGEELKKETAAFQTFQLEHSIEQIWEGILEKLGVDSEQILREGNMHETSSEVSGMEGDVQSSKQTKQDSSVPTLDNMGAQETSTPFEASQQHASKVVDDTDGTLIKESDAEFHSPYEDTENAVESDSAVQSERSTEAVDGNSTVDDETSETNPTPKPVRANAKVTEEQVREIRARREAGESYSKLAKEFGLTPTGVRNIALRNTWKHVE